MTPESSPTDKLRPSLVRLSDVEFSSLMFRTLSAATTGSKPLVYGPAYKDLGSFDAAKLSGIVAEACENKWFVFYVEDCFDPPMYVVNGRSFEDAYGWFLCECEHLVKIEPEDMKDYGLVMGSSDDDRVTFNDNGTPCDTESVQGFEVQLVEAKR